MSKLVDGYKKVENSVIGGYQKVEDTVVGEYKKIEDKFVDTFLKKDGETTKEVKERLNREQQELADKNKTIVEESLKLSKEINDKYAK